MYPEWPPEGVLPLLGIRGRLESELGPEGGGCCGRVDADCEEWEGCAEGAEGGAGLGARMEGEGARAVRGSVKVSMAGSHIMVRCGFVCYCMFDWLVGFHNLILLVDFRLFD